MGNVQGMQVRRGLKKDLITLPPGEFGFCTDTNELFIGSPLGNVKVATDLNAADMKQTAIALPEGVDPNVNNALGTLNLKKANNDEVVKLTGNQTIAGTKTFSASPVSSVAASTNNQLVRFQEAVRTTGNQTIGGVKTFTEIPYFQQQYYSQLSLRSSGYNTVMYGQVGPGTGAIFVATGTVTENTNLIGLTISPASFFSHRNNEHDLGKPESLWKTVYAATGMINTSDERQKTDIAALSNIKDFFMSLEPVSHKFINGQSGRTHHGLIAQKVEQAMIMLGLSDMDFAGLIKSPIYEAETRITGQEKITIPAVWNEDNTEIIEPERTETIDVTENIPIEERKIIDYTYGLRYTEFIPMLIKMVQDQQKVIDDMSLLALQQQQTIDDLTARMEKLEAR